MQGNVGCENSVSTGKDCEKNMLSPKVSVCVITYNHEKYIRQCLQSIIDQETNFIFEVIVADDCSTDGTKEIVLEFKERYPSVIRTLFQEVNTGGSKNNIDVHNAAKGEYVAHMDGDDYALPGKLQKQVEFLDANKNCSFVCHRVQIVNEDGTKILGVHPRGTQPTYTDLAGLVKRYIFFNHSSKMYRRPVNKLIYSPGRDIIDFTIHVEHASTGDIGFLPDILACYRKVDGGITAATGESLYRLYELTLDGFERARQLGVSDEIVDYGKAKYLVGAAFLCLYRGDPDGYRKYLILSRINNKFFSFSHAILFFMRDHAKILLTLYKGRQLTLGWLRKIR